MTFLVILIALAIDYVFGEPKRFHPLVGFGRWVDWIEKTLNQTLNNSLSLRLRGIVALFLAVFPIIFFVMGLRSLFQSPYVYIFDALIVALCIGHKSLIQHAMAVMKPLLKSDINAARSAVAMIVSRDTANLNENEISKATIESVLENGSDAIFAALFWYVVAGLLGVVLYRLVNTLDAMWGYKTERFLYFGWFAARLDDVLNFIPARLSALSYAMAGQFNSAIKCWRDQGKLWYSINAGPVMAAGAGAIEVKLGGDSIYHGKLKSRPVLGLGSEANASHIDKAARLVTRAVLIWLAAILLITLILSLFS